MNKETALDQWNKFRRKSGLSNAPLNFFEDQIWKIVETGLQGARKGGVTVTTEEKPGSILLGVSKWKRDMVSLVCFKRTIQRKIAYNWLI